MVAKQIPKKPTADEKERMRKKKGRTALTNLQASEENIKRRNVASGFDRKGFSKRPEDPLKTNTPTTTPTTTPIVDPEVKETPEVKEEIEISKRLEKDTFTVTDDSGNVKEIPIKLALELGLVEGITGEEQNQKLVELGLISAGVTGGQGAIKSIASKAEGIAANRILKLNNIKKYKNAFPTTADDIIKYGKNILKLKKGEGNAAKFGKKGLYGLGALYGLNEFLLQPNELATWAAIDNVAGQSSFIMNNLYDDVLFGNIEDPEKIQEIISDATEHVKGAKRFVTFSTMLNPKLWANGKQLREAINVAENSIISSANKINELLQGG